MKLNLNSRDSTPSNWRSAIIGLCLVGGVISRWYSKEFKQKEKNVQNIPFEYENIQRGPTEFQFNSNQNAGYDFEVKSLADSNFANTKLDRILNDTSYLKKKSDKSSNQLKLHRLESDINQLKMEFENNKIPINENPYTKKSKYDLPLPNLRKVGETKIGDTMNLKAN